MKNKGLIIGLSAVGFLVLIAIWMGSAYNGFVTKQEAVNAKWADVQSDYQRRADLIPNLVNTVKGYADFEKETLTDVIDARAKATSVTIDPANMTPEKLQEFMANQNGLTSALGKLMVVVERYPELKANQNFLDLQAQLEGTENRIKIARNNFNEATREYNTAIRAFPKNTIASMFGFDKMPFFESAEGADKAPEVQF